MDISFSELAKAAVLGIVEGVTEFLPISSTGHLIVTGDMIGFTGERAKAFEIFIQLGAILSVVWLYWRKIFNFSEGWISFWTKVFVSFLPAAVVGLALHSYIKDYLFTVPVVAISLIVGGIAILLIEGIVQDKKSEGDVADVTVRQAFWIGAAQVLALIPGVSRSGATIMGGLLQKLDRKTATEYSFFLALPTMLAATTYDLYKSRESLQVDDAVVFGVGFFVAFITAIIAIKTFMKFISTHSFKSFAWYRIAFGALLILLFAVGEVGVA